MRNMVEYLAQAMPNISKQNYIRVSVIGQQWFIDFCRMFDVDEDFGTWLVGYVVGYTHAMGLRHVTELEPYFYKKLSEYVKEKELEYAVNRAMGDLNA